MQVLVFEPFAKNVLRLMLSCLLDDYCRHSRSAGVNPLVLTRSSIKFRLFYWVRLYPTNKASELCPGPGCQQVSPSYS